MEVEGGAEVEQVEAGTEAEVRVLKGGMKVVAAVDAVADWLVRGRAVEVVEVAVGREQREGGAEVEAADRLAMWTAVEAVEEAVGWWAKESQRRVGAE